MSGPRGSAGWLEGEAGLREMCNRGVEMLAASRSHDTLRFDCFYKSEADFCKAYMAERHPAVPFFTTHMTFGAAQ